MRSSKNEHLFFVFLGSASTETDGVKAGGCLSEGGREKTVRTWKLLAFHHRVQQQVVHTQSGYGRSRGGFWRVQLRIHCSLRF